MCGTGDAHKRYMLYICECVLPHTYSYIYECTLIYIYDICTNIYVICAICVIQAMHTRGICYIYMSV